MLQDGDWRDCGLLIRHAALEAAASHHIPNWARGQEAESVRTWGAAMLRPYESRNDGHAERIARGIRMPAEDEAR